MGAPEKAAFEHALTTYFNKGHAFTRPPTPPEDNRIRPLNGLVQLIPAPPPAQPPGVTHLVLTFTLQADGTYACSSA